MSRGLAFLHLLKLWLAVALLLGIFTGAAVVTIYSREYFPSYLWPSAWSLPPCLARWSPWQAWDTLSNAESNGWIRLWAPEVSSHAKAALQGLTTTLGTIVLSLVALKVPALQPFLRLLSPMQHPALPTHSQPTLSNGNIQGQQMQAALSAPMPMHPAHQSWGQLAHLWQSSCHPATHGYPCGPPIPPPFWGSLVPALPQRHLPALCDISSQRCAPQQQQMQLLPMPHNGDPIWLSGNHSQGQIACVN